MCLSQFEHKCELLTNNEFILWTSRMSGHKFLTIHLIFVEIFQSKFVNLLILIVGMRQDVDTNTSHPPSADFKLENMNLSH